MHSICTVSIILSNPFTLHNAAVTINQNVHLLTENIIHKLTPAMFVAVHIGLYIPVS
jgi:hypothetical protein